MQVVTSENFQQLIETGKVDEYKPPVAAEKQPEKAEAEAEPAQAEQPRGADGKFVKEEVKVDEVDASFDEDLRDPSITMPEKVRRQIARKHVDLKKAEGAAEILRAERQAERERADRAEASLKALQDERSGTAAPAKDPKEPKAEDYKTVGEYAEALADYKVEEKFAERDAREKQERLEQAAASAQADFNKRIAATAKDIPDYHEVIQASDIDMPPHITVYIAESPLGPKLGYHFAKNPDEYDRIAKLSPI